MPRTTAVSRSTAVARNVASKNWGNALQFTAASNQYVDVASHASLQLTGALTIMGWIYPVDRNDYYAIVSKFTDDNNCEYVVRLQTSTGILHAQFGSGAANEVATSTNAIPINTWTHFAMVHEADTTVTFYINGAVDSNSTTKAFGTATAANLNIGRRTGGFAPFNGYMDDIRIYNTALRGTDVQDIYQYPNIGRITDSLVSWWKFDENTGTTASDSKGNNDGDLTGHAPSWIASTVPSGRTLVQLPFTSNAKTIGTCSFGMTFNDNVVDPDATNQLTIIKNLGFDRVRLLFVDYAWSAGITRWRSVVQAALALDLYTVYGISAITTGITSANYSSFADAVKTEAAWCQTQNDPNLEFQIGNEEALHHDGSISDATLITNLKTLATEVQAIYTVGKVSYTDWAGVVQAWMDAGLGDLDYFGLNMYNDSTAADDQAAFRGVIDWVYGTWRGQVFISEFAPDSRGLVEAGVADTDANLYAKIFEQQMLDIAAKPFTSAYMYTWKYENDLFGLVREADNTPRAWYYPLLGLRKAVDSA